MDTQDSAVPTHGQQVITACAVIYRVQNGVTEILLAKRANTKKFLPNHYELPGGHIEYGEQIETGPARELKEESLIKP